jgi:hypothetical protein
MTAGGSPPHERPQALPPRTPLTRHNSTGSCRASLLTVPSMAEKVRENYQRHSRNISTVSDISVSLAEPLHRDQTAEIRCILLCDSELERTCLFEAVGRCLADGESSVGNVTLVHHHWEQPCTDCSGPGECKLCVPLPAGSSVAAFLPTTHPPPGLPHEGFFRFAVGGTSFRLMLLSKDRQNLLKIYSYDVLLVGMQVTAANGRQVLDTRIWEFEWKRLDRHTRKAVAPPILLGYFRDILKLGLTSTHSNASSGGNSAFGEVSLKRTLDEAKSRVRKAGLTHHAIPRTVDFVTGTSKQLEGIFEDVRKLFHQPGYVLQQCAYVNNQAHFCKIVENPNLTEEDMLYSCETTGDNPIMIAAKMRHKDLVSAVLRSPKFLNNECSDLLRNVIHSRNLSGQTLLSMVALQGESYEFSLKNRRFRL